MKNWLKTIQTYKYAAIPLALLLIVAVSYQNCGSNNTASSTPAASASSVDVVTLSPQAVTIASGATQQITATNAPSGSTFVLVSGPGSVDPTTGVYTSVSATAMDTAVIALQTGSTNAVSVATITISAAPATPVPLAISPTSAHITAGDNLTFAVVGGAAPYTYSVSGAGSIDSNGGFTSAGSGGSATVTVTDSNGLTTTASVVAKVSICQTASETGTVSISCPTGTSIQSIDFASYGTPTDCGTPAAVNGCNAASSMSTVQSECEIGDTDCDVDANNDEFPDPCEGVTKHLTIQLTCDAPAVVPAQILHSKKK